MTEPDNGAAKDDSGARSPLLITKADDFDALRASIVDAASVSGGLWITYLGILFYMLVAIGSVSHKDLFLANLIKLPFMNVDLPMKGFFSIGPALFLIAHTYVLLHFALLGGKIGAFDHVLMTQITDEEARSKLRRQLPTNIFVQLLAGPSEVRNSATGVLLWLIALISLVIAPILLLLFFEVRFLPYHNEWVTWWQRIVVLLDLGVLWLLFWPVIRVLRKSDAASMSPRRLVWTIVVMVLLTLCSPPLLLIATFPEETLHFSNIPGASVLIDGKINQKTLLQETPFSSLLMLPKFDAVGEVKLDSEEKLKDAQQTIAVTGRYLQGVNLKLADLRKANFIASDLTNAKFGSADLREARLDTVDLSNAELDHTKLTGAHLNAAILRGANLEGADLTKANLSGADLTDANLNAANLTGANLTDANLTGARPTPQPQVERSCGRPAAPLPAGVPAAFRLVDCPPDWEETRRAR